MRWPCSMHGIEMWHCFGFMACLVGHRRLPEVFFLFEFQNIAIFATQCRGWHIPANVVTFTVLYYV